MTGHITCHFPLLLNDLIKLSLGTILFSRSWSFWFMVFAIMLNKSKLGWYQSSNILQFPIFIDTYIKYFYFGSDCYIQTVTKLNIFLTTWICSEAFFAAIFTVLAINFFENKLDFSLKTRSLAFIWYPLRQNPLIRTL